MSFILVASIAIRLGALGVALALLARLRDWRVGILAAMIGLMAARQGLTLLKGPLTWPISLTANVDELPGLAVSVLVLLAIIFLGRMIRDRRKAESRAAEAHAQLVDAVESISEGFVLFDADERLVLCNSRFREFYPKIADLLVPGVTIETITRAAAERGQVLDTRDDLDGWIAMRLAQFRTAEGSHEQHLAGGRWLLASERKTHDGGVAGIRTDITEQKRIASELLENQMLLRALVDNVPAHVCLKDVDGRYLLINRDMARRLGINEDAAKGKTVRDVFSKEVADQSEAEDQQVLDTGAPLVTEETIPYPDGEHINLVTRFPILDASGSITRIGVFSTDITARKRSEENLRKSEQMLLETQRIANVAGWEWDEIAGRLSWASPEYGRLLGLEGDYRAFTVEDHARVIHPDDRDDYMQAFEDCHDDPKPVDVVYRIVRPDGEVRHIHTRAEPILDDHGKLIGFTGTDQDVTERRRADEARRKNERLLREAERIAGIASWEWDEIEGRLTWVSPEYASLFGLADDVLGRTDDDFLEHIHPDDRERYQRLYRETNRDPKAYEMDYRIVRPDGEVRYIRGKAEPAFDGEGRLVGFSGTEQDVTGAKRAEAELRKSERLMREAQRIAGIASWEWDEVNARMSWTSPEYARLLGIDGDTSGLTKDDLVALVHPDDREAYLRNYQETHDDPRPYEQEYRIVRPDGAVRHIHVKTEPLFDDDGALIGFAGTEQDITDARRAEEDLRKSEAMLREAERIASLASWEWDVVAGRMIWTSPEYMRLYGLEGDVESVTLDVHLAMLHPDDRAEYLRTYEESRKNPGPREFEFRIVRADGEVRHIQVKSEPVFDDDGNLIRYTGTAQDVTEQRRADQALRESEARFRTIYNKTPAMMYSIDRQGRLISVSDFWCQYMGYDRKEVIGRRSTDFLTEESRKLAVESIFPLFFDTGHIKDVPYQFVRKDGTVIDTLVSAIAEYNDAGDILRSLAVINDVTEMKQVQHQLQQAQKMEAVGQLTGGVAHDFNNILTVILGNLQLVERRLGDEPRLQKQVQTAITAARRAADLINRLLVFSRRQILEPATVDVGAMIAGMDHLLRRTLGETVAIKAVTGRGLWLARVDPGQLEHAVLNLAINARDAMAEGGIITIEARNAPLDEDYAATHTEVGAGDYVMIAVSDTGGGMPPEVIEQAFDPFFTTKGVGKGSGLGLSMVYGFIKQSGGHVSIYSEVGRGTTVRLYLPRAAADDAPESKEDAGDETPPRGDETILVVEDDAPVRATTVAMLEDLGYRIREAADGQETLAELARDAAVDLILTDVVMPGGMTGWELAEEVRRRYPAIKMIFASGYTENAIPRLPGFNSDDDLISKPYRQIELARKLREILDR